MILTEMMIDLDIDLGAIERIQDLGRSAGRTANGPPNPAMHCRIQAIDRNAPDCCRAVVSIG
jgi:hypothetical protein